MNLIKKIDIKEVVRPLRVIFSTSLGRKNILKSIIIKVRLDNGKEGTGECPTSFVSRLESLDSIKKILNSILPGLVNMSIDNYSEKIETLRDKFRQYPMTISGLELALFRAYLENRGIGEHEYWGARLHEIETDITIPFITEKEPLDRWLRYAIKKRFKVFKIKVSGGVEADIPFLHYIHSILSDSLKVFTIRLDGNQGFTGKGLLKFSDHIEKKGIKIELFEQPLLKDDYKGMKAVRKKTRFPIIIDETVFNSKDLIFAISEDICDGINIKIAKSGVLESLRMIEIARKNNLRLMAGCMTETMVGLSAGIHMTAGSGVFDFIDLDSIYYMHHRNIYDGIQMNPPFFTIKQGDR